MNRKSVLIAATIVASLTLGGCDQVKKLVGGGEPKGQVVATVDGDEITALELRREMNGFSSPDADVMKAAQQRALQQIILRRLIVDKAKEEKLDKTPDHQLMLKRGEETLLMQEYQRKLAAATAVPSRQDAENYIVSHPQKFADRKVILVDQLIAGPNKIPPERFRPLNTLEEVKALLTAEGVAYQANVATLDTLTADPRLVEAIGKLPSGEVFVLPQQQGSLLFNRVIETRAVPFGGDPAIAYATNALRSERAQESVTRSIELMRKGAESKIVYNPAYKPPAAPTQKAGGEKAAPAASPPAATTAPVTSAPAPAPK